MRLDTRSGNRKRYGEAEELSKTLVTMFAYYAGGPVGCNCLDMPEGYLGAVLAKALEAIIRAFK